MRYQKRKDVRTSLSKPLGQHRHLKCFDENQVATKVSVAVVSARGHFADDTRRHVAASTHLEVQFSITVATPAALKTMTSSLQAQSASGTSPSALATTLVSTGVISSASAVQVKSVKTSVTTGTAATPAPPLTSSPPLPTTTAAPTPASSALGSIIGVIVGAVVVFGEVVCSGDAAVGETEPEK
ncbi:Aste57867_20145 [Aphanomyces stellatus]|uniref:Aste57867_20145 protein n=1 Tax=Aphanomyces stellatus TaxID=120398 RepID=A0A485LF01_9STRA|nr:hypothetical protein As57867_020079 [Aphanomyces stellatus]VFT96840.1 Aste57867_20145 [Aphanomyces stellatus]